LSIFNGGKAIIDVHLGGRLMVQLTM